MRVLVASSKDWPEHARVGIALQECLGALPVGETLTVVHGCSRKGADAAADRWAWWAGKQGWPVEPPERHPAPWSDPCRTTCPRKHRRNDPRGHTVCPTAGYYRNEDMASLGADICIAFVVPGAKEAEQLVRVAGIAGIPVVVFTPRAAACG